ncbi:N-6 DNA methylase [Pseudarthrobacter sp. fls2-241-R2A-127]|uniref:Eco57I restriction-modification methylase domain-containing protein n=1 Tax=Pseudarthrobacter sp. fls2-241-R2A-127 TaxID=3040303 RepID=UPI002552231B|nr:N-6 DNA methylase [Pseudarthrobacter sp. fls2-241-R2A-127]
MHRSRDEIEGETLAAKVASSITDERTMAAWILPPTAIRAAARQQGDEKPARILSAEIEEHVRDPDSGSTLRCDVTLRGKKTAVVAIEMKRPEVADVRDPVMTVDAHKKAASRGLVWYGTCNFKEIALWSTHDGPRPTSPLFVHPLVTDLTHSSKATLKKNRDALGSQWMTFIDRVELLLDEVEANQLERERSAPPQVSDLRDAVHEAAQEAAVRIAEAVQHDQSFHDQIVEILSDQFGVSVKLDPTKPEQLEDDSLQVAEIACFVVATRLMVYTALRASGLRDGRFKLDALDVPARATDPARVAQTLQGFYDHARYHTGDFEVQFTPGPLDDVAFVPSASQAASDVGRRWDSLIRLISDSDWSGPAEYVPGLYESLLDEEHRHATGVHYTPEPVAEIAAAYAIERGNDVVMDPAAGAGTFVSMCVDRKTLLGSSHEQALSETYAVELAEFAASLTGLNLVLANSKADTAYPRVVVSDFFKLAPGGATQLVLPETGKVFMPTQIDAVVGNPPYIRFENISQDERRHIHELLSKVHAEDKIAFPNFTGKADLWAFFVARATQYLRPGGRLAFVLSWSLLSSNYGDAVLSFLGRYFQIDAIIDSKIERFFAAKQNTLLLLARKVDDPGTVANEPNPHIDPEHQIRFVRLKRPVAELVDSTLPRGQRAEDLIDEIFKSGGNASDADDVRWDINLIRQSELVERSDSMTIEDFEQ